MRSLEMLSENDDTPGILPEDFFFCTQSVLEGFFEDLGKLKYEL